MLAITFTDRSCCTLPMISTAWLRCQLESYAPSLARRYVMGEFIG